MDDNSTGMSNVIPMQLENKRASDEAEVFRCHARGENAPKRTQKMPNQELEME